MSNTYVKNNGTWSAARSIYIKNSGVWSPVKKIYSKQNGVWSKVFPPSGSVTYGSGSGWFTVPDSIYSLNVTYPTTGGLTTQVVGVTPGQSLYYAIGGFGAGSTFGPVSTPEYSLQVLAYSGSVDHYLNVTFSVASPNGGSMHATGGNSGSIQPSAAANGMIYQVDLQNGHGDLYADVWMTNPPSSSVLFQTQNYFNYADGRRGKYLGGISQSGAYWLSSFSLQDFPSASGENGYAIGVQFRQVVGFIISW